MAPQDTDFEELELPGIEAMLAGTLALMTGYSQALQAALDPHHRLNMGVKIRDNLSLLVDHPQLSLGFRQILLGLQRRWHAMSECTEQAAAALSPCPIELRSGERPGPRRFQVSAPKRLQ